MTTYFVAASGSNTSPYDTWAKAATSLQTALTEATGSGDIVAIQYNGVPSADSAIAADKTWTIGGNILIIASTNSGTDTITPTPMGDINYLGAASTAYSLTIQGAFNVRLHGITFRCAGTGPKNIKTAASDLAHYEFEGCIFYNNNNDYRGAITFGPSGLRTGQAYVKLVNCELLFGHVSQKVIFNAKAVLENCRLHASTVAPNVGLFNLGGVQDVSGSTLDASNCDFSLLGSNAIFVDPVAAPGTAWLRNCKLGAGFAGLGPGTNLSGHETFLFNCSSGDQHYHIGHYNPLGSTICETGIYANDGAQYDGTNYVSLRINTTANCSILTPYTSPWFEQYHDATSAITPSVEILRDGSATAYQNDEVWGEFGYQGTSGSTQGSVVTDRAAWMASPADQTGGVGTSGWTGEGGTAWSGKLNPTAAITPAEIGMLRARVVVAEPSITVYVDPTIRL